MAARNVLMLMQLAFRAHRPPVMQPVAPTWRSARGRHGGRRYSPSMPPETDMIPDRADWAHAIGAVATQQDRAAFARLFEYFAPRIKTYLQRSGVAEARAEELAQDTMLKVWRKASLFDPASAGGAAWIFSIARNVRIDALRREHRGGVTETSEVEAEFQIDESTPPDSRLDEAQSEQRVRSALAELPPDQMRVIELSFFEEKAHAEIARILEIPLGTVKSRARLAMNRLRNLLGESS
jgi:RNA polymerase sigma-70 factor (ECF subfamily)